MNVTFKRYRFINAVLNVPHAPEVDVRQARTLNIFLVGLMILLTIITASLALINSPSKAVSFGMLSLAVIPTYLLNKRGHFYSAVVYFIITYSLSILSGSYLGAINHFDISVLMDCFTGLYFTLVVAVLTTQPIAALLVLLLNSALVVAMYLEWRPLYPTLQTDSALVTVLVTPLFDQVLVVGIYVVLLNNLRDVYARFKAEERNAQRGFALFNKVLRDLPIGIGIYNVCENTLNIRNPLLNRYIGQEAQPPYHKVQRESDELEIKTLDASQNIQELPWIYALTHPDIFNKMLQTTLTYPDETQQHVEEHLVPIYNDAQQLTHIVYVVTDTEPYHKLQMSTQKLLNQRRDEVWHEAQTIARLREIDQQKSRFLAAFSHDLKTPLSAIVGYADIILHNADRPIDAQLSKDIEAIYAAGGMLRDMVGRILDAAQLDAGHAALSRERLDLREPIRQVQMTLQGQAEHRRLALKCSVPDVPVWIDADPTRIQQVILNLLSNAIAYTVRGTVHINLNVAEGRAVVRVKDTGIGIAAEHLDHVFEWFYQVDGTDTRRRSGTGLGLPIARSLIELHGGKLWVQSTPGHGSEFTFYVPLADSITADASSDPSPTLSHFTP